MTAPHDTLPAEITALTRPLFEALPLEQAMQQLVVQQPAAQAHHDLVGQLVLESAIAARPALASALWLYVDDLDRSHVISQDIDTPTGSYWHGIMHRREGDFSNSHYWFRKVGNHPAIAVVREACGGEYDPHTFIDEAEAVCTKGESPAKLIRRQQIEWITLFGWCAAK